MLPALKIGDEWRRPRLEHTVQHSRLVATWSGTQPWRVSRRHYARRLRRPMALEGEAERQARVDKWLEKEHAIGEALNELDWKRLRAAPGMHARTGELWHKLRLHQVRLWDKVQLTDGCPRKECTTDAGADTAHIVWQCSRAQALWAKVAAQWECLSGVSTGLKHAIFSWQPPATKIQWTELIQASAATGATADERWARLRHWRQIAWRQLCSSVIAHLWYKRVAETHEPTMDPPEADWPTVLVRWRAALFGTTAYLSSASTDTRDLDLVLHRRLCRRLLQDDIQAVSVPISRDARYLLFFDGGSRGNPGPGGSGAVIVTIQPGSHVARLVWVAAMSYASASTTNNLAEYRGLRTGLQAAADHKWHPLHVIGDSQLILTQMRRRTPPKTASLCHEYSKAQQLCDGLVIAGWHHHYRTYNKMADKAANVAMDECASTQVYAESSRPLIRDVQLLMQQDVYHWAAAQWSDT